MRVFWSGSGSEDSKVTDLTVSKQPCHVANAKKNQQIANAPNEAHEQFGRSDHGAEHA